MSERVRRVARNVLAAATLLQAAALIELAQAASDAGGKRADTAQARQWIAQMKTSPRGPFVAIKWFCKDGRVLPPQDYDCAKKGEGWQHGEWSARSKALRAQGYEIANVLAGLDAAAAVAAPDFADRYAQLLIEKFLVAVDDGWIFRKARFYRGAIQEEDEREAARALLIAMAADEQWIGTRFPALRAGVRLLPHGRDTASAQKVRSMAAALAERDPDFQPLRVKIHGSPEAGDAKSVREYASNVADPELKKEYASLALEIDRVYAPRALGDVLEANARVFSRAPWLQRLLRDARSALGTNTGPAYHYLVTSKLLAALRDALPRIKSSAARLRVLDLSLAVEADNFRLASALRATMAKSTRAGLVLALSSSVEAAYGTGMINARERAELARHVARLSGDTIGLADYRHSLRSLGLVPGWGSQRLQLHFSEAMATLAAIEPLAQLFVQDQLRGSPLLFYAQILDRLSRDANRLAGVQHRLFGKDIGTGFNALNPGLARGTLRAAPDMTRVAAFSSDGIYLLPETVADLPPIGGILTAGAGNPLSHVQLLARNLGIPNVAVDAALLSALRDADGRRIVLAVSRAGLVEIDADGPRWNALLGAEGKATTNLVFEPDLKKLDLSKRSFVTLSDLRASDSGRIVGPKAAKLGELSARFPGRVAPGVGIPFGLYRQTVLERPYRASGKTVYQWMVERFRALEALPAGSPEADAFGEKLRSEIYAIVSGTEPGPEFRARLHAAMDVAFGPEFRGGVFIRSDTNVEDLPGFTGAGLNLTLFNVVGFENIVKGIARVWASPYTRRAWAWRQSHMKGPEHVYPAVLLQQTVPADLSGVMITQDIDNGDPSVLSVAVNEGVGGAVEGQAAESIRIDTRSGEVSLLGSATAPRRTVPLTTGGIAKLPVSGADTLLGAGEIRQLIDFAREIPRQFPQRGEDGQPVAADVEFAFLKGKLWLLQIRPFNESRRAQGSDYLIQMDKALAANLNRNVNLNEVIR